MSFQAENSSVLKRIERIGLAKCPERTEFFPFFLFLLQNFTASDVCLLNGSVLSKHFFSVEKSVLLENV